MAAGGFDVVLGNPPWERIKLQEQEFFAAREPEIANAPNAAARGKLIARLRDAEPGSRDRALYEEFETAKRIAEALSVFARVSEEERGRFPLTGRGDINTYALFAELFATLAGPRGRAGVIVVGKLLDANDPNRGFDAQTGNYVDMVKAGIIDPTKVVRLALQNAASVAGLLVTTEAMVAEKPEKKTQPAMPHDGGMDDF